MSVEFLVGAVVYAHHEGEMYLALVHDVFGHWTLAKGKVEPGEGQTQALCREMREELGLDVEPGALIGTNSYLMHHPKKGRIKKVVTYYMARAPYQPLVLEEKEGSAGLDGVQWIKPADLKEANLYGDVMQIIETAMSILEEGDTAKATS